MASILSKAHYVRHLYGRVISYDPDDTTPSLYWSPEFSVFCDGQPGHQQQLWGLADKPQVMAVCRLHQIRFIDFSESPRITA